MVAVPITPPKTTRTTEPVIESDFRAIVSSTKPAVLGAIRHHLAVGLRDMIDDVAQETYLRIYRYIEKNGMAAIRQEALSSFAYVIARNESLRANKKHRRARIEVPDSLPDLLAHRQSEMQATMQAALGLLDPDLQPIFGLRTAGFSTDEIATKLGMPSGTVKSRLHRARRVLRERAADWFG